jgi:hypothetical protein
VGNALLPFQGDVLATLKSVYSEGHERAKRGLVTLRAIRNQRRDRALRDRAFAQVRGDGAAVDTASRGTAVTHVSGDQGTGVTGQTQRQGLCTGGGKLLAHRAAVT